MLPRTMTRRTSTTTRGRLSRTLDLRLSWWRFRWKVLVAGSHAQPFPSIQDVALRSARVCSTFSTWLNHSSVCYKWDLSGRDTIITDSAVEQRAGCII